MPPAPPFCTSRPTPLPPSPPPSPTRPRPCPTRPFRSSRDQPWTDSAAYKYLDQFCWDLEAAVPPMFDDERAPAAAPAPSPTPSTAQRGAILPAFKHRADAPGGRPCGRAEAHHDRARGGRNRSSRVPPGAPLRPPNFAISPKKRNARGLDGGTWEAAGAASPSSHPSSSAAGSPGECQWTD